MRDIEKTLLQYLPEPGQMVYLQATGRRHRKKVSTLEITNEDAVDFLLDLHGKYITNDDLQENIKGYKTGQKLGTRITFSNGQKAIVLASFHWGFTEKEIEKLLQEEKIESADEATPTILCCLYTNEKVILTKMEKCNLIEDT